MSTSDAIIFAFGLFVVSLLGSGLFVTVRYFRSAGGKATPHEGDRR
ncbi:MAG: hypothetical protein NTY35_02440 [Planctomycetota bacterium]|nr:hypothetical protein [Planctomycetota bacterium]